MRRILAMAAEGARALRRHPLRSALTAATSAVAIAVTVNVISLVYGLDADLRYDTGRFGRRTVDVVRLPILVPGIARAPLGEAERVRVEDLVRDLPARVVTRRIALGRAAGDAEIDRQSLVAVSTGYPDTLDLPLPAGRWLEEGDLPGTACVLDASVAALLFPGASPPRVVGRTVRLAGPAGDAPRRVVGVLADPLQHRDLFDAFDEGRGARTLTSALLSFRNVYLEASALGDGEYNAVSVVAPSEAQVSEVVRRLHAVWPAAKDGSFLPRQSVGVFVRRDWMDLVGSTSQAGALLSNVVWMIIVGVAIVMITTLNLLSIRERYDELAIRRVEGAGKGDVAWQVTAEGVLLSLLGGLAGLPVGFAGAAVLRRMVDFPFRFEVGYAAAATVVAVAIGLLASVLPARRAASLDPVRVLTRRPT